MWPADAAELLGVTEDEYRAREERNQVPKLYRELLELKCGELGALSGAWAGFRLVNGALFPPDYARGFPPERILAIHWLQESNAALRAELRAQGRPVPEHLDRVQPCGLGPVQVGATGKGKPRKSGSAGRGVSFVEGLRKPATGPGLEIPASTGDGAARLAAAGRVLPRRNTGPPVEIFRPPVPLDNTTPAVGRVTSPALRESSGTHTVSLKPTTGVSKSVQWRKSFAHPRADSRQSFALNLLPKPMLCASELSFPREFLGVLLGTPRVPSSEFERQLSRQVTGATRDPFKLACPGELGPSGPTRYRVGETPQSAESATPIAVGSGFGSTSNRGGVVPAQLASAAHRFESASLGQGLLTSLSAAPTLPKNARQGKGPGYTLCAIYRF